MDLSTGTTNMETAVLENTVVCILESAGNILWCFRIASMKKNVNDVNHSRKVRVGYGCIVDIFWIKDEDVCKYRPSEFLMVCSYGSTLNYLPMRFAPVAIDLSVLHTLGALRMKHYTGDVKITYTEAEIREGDYAVTVIKAYCVPEPIVVDSTHSTLEDIEDELKGIKIQKRGIRNKDTKPGRKGKEDSTPRRGKKDEKPQKTNDDRRSVASDTSYMDTSSVNTGKTPGRITKPATNKKLGKTGRTTIVTKINEYTDSDSEGGLSVSSDKYIADIIKTPLKMENTIETVPVASTSRTKRERKRKWIGMECFENEDTFVRADEMNICRKFKEKKYSESVIINELIMENQIENDDNTDDNIEKNTWMLWLDGNSIRGARHDSGDVFSYVYTARINGADGFALCLP